MKLANEKVQVLKGKSQGIQGQVESLAEATPQRLDSLRRRLANVEKLLQLQKAAQPVLKAVTDQMLEIEKQKAELETVKSKLARIKTPAEIQSIAVEFQKAEKRSRETMSELNLKQKALSGWQEKQEALPDRKTVQSQMDLHVQLSAVAVQVGEAERRLKEVLSKEAELKRLADEAKAAAVEAEGTLQHERTGHQAYVVASKLTSGEACPVCGGRFERFPGTEPQNMRELEAKSKLATDKAAKTSDEYRRQSFSREEAANQIQKLSKEQSRLQLEVAGLPPESQVRQISEELDRLESEMKRGIREMEAVRKDNEQSNSLLQRLQRTVDSARQGLRATRNEVATLGPLPAETHDLLADWQSLTTWAAGQVSRLEVQVELLRSQLIDVKTREEQIREELVLEAQVLGLAEVASFYEDCLRLSASLQKECEQVEQQVAKARELAAELAEIKQKGQVLQKLANLLKTNAFETWYLNRSFKQLCTAASGILLDLSKQEYSLTVTDKNDFQIVDHFNADEIRAVRTLSGGETFLASLSLALALSEQVARSSASASRLESLFLDEGFGTLDPETLETVASTIEEMGAKGRMIGVITHVRELAERLPTRFEVRKGAAGSAVEKVLA